MSATPPNEGLAALAGDVPILRQIAALLEIIGEGSPRRGISKHA